MGRVSSAPSLKTVPRTVFLTLSDWNMVVQRRTWRRFLELPVSALPRTPFIRRRRRSFSSPSNPVNRTGLNQEKAPWWVPFLDGADNRIWTGDLILTKDALYLLSYISVFCSQQFHIITHMSDKCKCFFKLFWNFSENGLKSAFWGWNFLFWVL